MIQLDHVSSLLAEVAEIHTPKLTIPPVAKMITSPLCRNANRSCCSSAFGRYHKLHEKCGILPLVYQLDISNVSPGYMPDYGHD